MRRFQKEQDDMQKITNEDAAKSQRALNAMLQMDKIDIAGLKQASEQP